MELTGAFSEMVGAMPGNPLTGMGDFTELFVVRACHHPTFGIGAFMADLCGGSPFRVVNVLLTPVDALGGLFLLFGHVADYRGDCSLTVSPDCSYLSTETSKRFSELDSIFEVPPRRVSSTGPGMPERSATLPTDLGKPTLNDLTTDLTHYLGFQPQSEQLPAKGTGLPGGRTS